MQPAPAPFTLAVLDPRPLIEVTGEDRHRFLQGLLTADLGGRPENGDAAGDADRDANRGAAPTPDTAPVARAVYALMLNAQGRFLHDLFLVDLPDRILLETAGDRVNALIARLLPYRLRARVQLAPTPDRWRVAVLLPAAAAPHCRPAGADGDGDGDEDEAAGGVVKDIRTHVAAAGGWCFTDPRTPGLGLRLWLPESRQDALSTIANLRTVPAAAYHATRIRLGVAEGGDLIPERALPLDYHLDRWGAIAWNKGCYLGQEVTARMHYRGLAKRGLIRARLAGNTNTGVPGTGVPGTGVPGTGVPGTVAPQPPGPGTPVMLDPPPSGPAPAEPPAPTPAAVGTLCSVINDLALAVIQRDLIDTWQRGGLGLIAGGQVLQPVH